MNTFESQGLQTPYDDDADDDLFVLLHGTGGRMGTAAGPAEFR